LGALVCLFVCFVCNVLVTISFFVATNGIVLLVCPTMEVQRISTAERIKQVTSLLVKNSFLALLLNRLFSCDPLYSHIKQVPLPLQLPRGMLLARQFLLIGRKEILTGSNTSGGSL